MLEEELNKNSNFRIYVHNQNVFNFRKNPGAQKLNDDWEIPVISEETLDKLTTMFTIYPE